MTHQDRAGECATKSRQSDSPKDNQPHQESLCTSDHHENLLIGLQQAGQPAWCGLRADPGNYDTNIMIKSTTGDPLDQFRVPVADAESDQPDLGGKRIVFDAMLTFEKDNKLESDELKWYRAQPGKEQKRISHTHSMVMSRSVKPLRFQVLDSRLPDNIKADIIRRHEVSMRPTPLGMVAMPDAKFQAYVDAALQLPLGVFESLPVDATDPDAVRAFTVDMRKRMDQVVYGQGAAKDAITETIVAWIRNPEFAAGTVLGLYGAPGVGKTSLIKYGLAGALDWPFAYISLAGTSQSGHLAGFSQTYEGSRWGAIAQELIQAHRMNVILMLDEVDKTCERRNHNEVMDFLCSLVDGSNRTFIDEYFSGIPLDLSKAMIVFGYNDPSRLTAPLRDRILEIKMDSFTPEQQVEIADKHLLPSLLSELTITREDLELGPKELRHLNERYAENGGGGVRGLRKALQRLLLRLNVLLMTRSVDALNHGGNKDLAIQKLIMSMKLGVRLIIDTELIDELMEPIHDHTKDECNPHMYM
jgi:ATP-dependent Lon protease